MHSASRARIRARRHSLTVNASIYIIAVTYSLAADAIQPAAYLLIFASALPVASADRSHPPDKTQPCRRKVHVGIGHRPAPNQNR